MYKLVEEKRNLFSQYAVATFKKAKYYHYMQNITNLSLLLNKYAGEFYPVVPYDLNHPSVLILDLSANNKHLQENTFLNTELFSQYISSEMAKANTPVAIGRYNENRIIYSRSNHFLGSETRSIHLGIDIWAKTETEVYSPLNGKIHSFRDNKAFGDYGPTIVLEHMLEGISFYTLYGHLTPDSIFNITINQEIEQGEIIGKIGNFPENGDWPPHLHFQIITNMKGYEGDFPGVAAPSRIQEYLHLCPDPNIILKIKKLMH